MTPASRAAKTPDPRGSARLESPAAGHVAGGQVLNERTDHLLAHGPGDQTGRLGSARTATQAPGQARGVGRGSSAPSPWQGRATTSSRRRAGRGRVDVPGEAGVVALREVLAPVQSRVSPRAGPRGMPASAVARVTRLVVSHESWSTTSASETGELASRPTASASPSAWRDADPGGHRLPAARAGRHPGTSQDPAGPGRAAAGDAQLAGRLGDPSGRRPGPRSSEVPASQPGPVPRSRRPHPWRTGRERCSDPRGRSGTRRRRSSAGGETGISHRSPGRSRGCGSSRGWSGSGVPTPPAPGAGRRSHMCARPVSSIRR